MSGGSISRLVRCSKATVELSGSVFRANSIITVRDFSIQNRRNQDSSDGSSSSSAMNSFIKGLTLPVKIKSDAAAKSQHKMLMEHARQIRKREMVRESRKPFSIMSSLANPKQVKRERITDFDAAMNILQTADDAGKSVPAEELLRYAAGFASVGMTKGVEICQKIMAEHNENTFDAEMHLDHYLANSLWNAGDFSKSVEIFKRIFYDNPTRRKKIADMFKFCIHRALQNYPNDEAMTQINDFINFCGEINEHLVAVYTWRNLFNNSSPAANQQAREIMEKYPQTKKFIVHQLDSTLNAARKNNDSFLLIRMLDLLKELPLENKGFLHWSKCILDALVDVCCNNQDVGAAKDVLKLAQQLKEKHGVNISPESVSKLSAIVRFDQPLIPMSTPKPRRISPSGVKLTF